VLLESNPGGVDSLDTTIPAARLDPEAAIDRLPCANGVKPNPKLAQAEAIESAVEITTKSQQRFRVRVGSFPTVRPTRRGHPN